MLLEIRNSGTAENEGRVFIDKISKLLLFINTLANRPSFRRFIITRPYFSIRSYRFRNRCYNGGWYFMRALQYYSWRIRYFSFLVLVERKSGTTNIQLRLRVRDLVPDFYRKFSTKLPLTDRFDMTII